MYTICNFNLSESSINIKSSKLHHTISMRKLWFFSHEQFLFTLQKTFEIYKPKITWQHDNFIIEISKNNLFIDF